ncbi:MAG: hypothetical protein A4E72_01587 [Syntrophus sp. PtaU1.Bin208]|nr:MAG: hypothetical protein A4E72_01587 [Syntrophus sp. PtaU1.Bin208]
MQIDMHYGAIYYLASLAGIGEEEAEKIAWSSQFVDDAEFGGTVQFSEGQGCICSNSAHRYITDNVSAHGRLVWIPYHFVPDTKTQGSFLDRLKCKKNSDLAGAAVQAALDETNPISRPYRFGVALHAYAETWSHYEFTGLWSDSNLIDHVEPVNVDQNWWESLKSDAGSVYATLKGRQESALGHLLADKCPDLPYLVWRYRVTAGLGLIPRNNPEDFWKAIRAMYRYMISYKGSASSPDIPPEHEKIMNGLIEQQEDDPRKRLSQWNKAISKKFHRSLPEYQEEKWIDDALGKKWKRDKCIISDATYQSFIKSHYWQFCEALRKHSDIIVSLLAKQGLYLV